MATVDDSEIQIDELINGVKRPTGPMTEDEFIAWCDEDVKAEWVDGEVIVMSPSSFRHVSLVGWMSTIMRLYVSAHHLGEVVGPEFTIRFAKGRRRRVPDVLFIARERLDLLRENHLEGAPDLAIEVVSPESVDRDRVDKFRDYRAAGVREYWIIDPDERDLKVYVFDERRRYRATDEVEGRVGSTVLPGFFIRTEWLWQSPLPDEWAVVRALGLLG